MQSQDKFKPYQALLTAIGTDPAASVGSISMQCNTTRICYSENGNNCGPAIQTCQAFLTAKADAAVLPFSNFGQLKAGDCGALPNITSAGLLPTMIKGSVLASSYLQCDSVQLDIMCVPAAFKLSC